MGGTHMVGRGVLVLDFAMRTEKVYHAQDPCREGVVQYSGFGASGLSGYIVGAGTRAMAEGDDLVRQAATPLQWWLSLWLWVSMCGMVLLIFIPPLLELIGVLPLGSG